MELAELQATPFKAAAQHLALLILRIVAGFSMIANHAWAMVYTGWAFYWKGESWGLSEAIGALDMPSPVVWATALALIFFVGSIFLILGLLGRLTSGVLLIAILGLLYVFFTHGTPDAPAGTEKTSYWIEVCILYALAYIVHFILGPGALALDRIFALLLGPRRHRSLEDVG